MISSVQPTQHVEPTPNDIAESLTGRRYLSWSQLSSYRQCPRQWFFSHVEQAKPAFVASSLIFGSCIHHAVQHYFEQQMEGEQPELDDLVHVFIKHWQDEQKERDLPIRYGKSEDEASLHELAKKMLEVFVVSMQDQPPLDVVAVEETFVGTVHRELPDLLARVDLLWLQEDRLHLMDFKTSRSRWSTHQCAIAADQLRLYARLAERSLVEVAIPMHFGVLTKMQSPAYQVMDVEPEPDKVPGIVKQALPIFKAMCHGVDYANPHVMHCSTCPYRKPCPSAV